MKDEKVWRKISKCTDGREVKSLSKEIRGMDWKKWNEVRESVMREAVRLLTSQDAILAELLKETHPLVMGHANPHENYWGIGLGLSNPLAKKKESWRGANISGKSWMERREVLMKGVRRLRDKGQKNEVGSLEEERVEDEGEGQEELSVEKICFVEKLKSE